MLCLRPYLALLLLSIALLDNCSGSFDAVSVEAADSNDGNDSGENIDCKANEEYSPCSANPTCEKTCDNIDHWEALPCSREKVCVRGCVCKEGYVRDHYRGDCVWENSCPRVKH